MSEFSEHYDVLSNEGTYLAMLRKILLDGDHKDDRTGVGTISLFGPVLHYGIETTVIDGKTKYKIPVFTTKSLFFKGIVTELLWFLSGNTNTNILRDQGNRIWEGNTSVEALNKLGLPYDEGELGPGYGYQWIHSGGTWGPNGTSEGGVNQIKYVIDELRKNPNSRRAVLNAWSASDLDKMALPPCHVMYVFNTDSENRLSCHLTLRSNDMFLGHPFNVVSASLLLILICKCVNMVPKGVTISIVDAHIYNNHVVQVNQQLERTPLQQPYLYIDKEISEYEDMLTLTYTDFKLDKYKSWPAIKAPMAV